MLYAIHFHKPSVSGAKREHIGYVDSYGNIMLHGQTVKYRAGLFESHKQANDYIAQNPEKFAEYKGMIIVEPFPQDRYEEMTANNYLKFCHENNVHFI